MASPQKENGFTPIAHEVLEALVRLDVGGLAFRVVFFVLRETWGRPNGPKTAALSETMIARGVAASERMVRRALKQLFSARVLFVEEAPSFVSSRRIGFQKNHALWLSCSPEDNSGTSVTNNHSYHKGADPSYQECPDPSYQECPLTITTDGPPERIYDGLKTYKDDERIKEARKAPPSPNFFARFDNLYERRYGVKQLPPDYGKACALLKRVLKVVAESDLEALIVPYFDLADADKFFRGGIEVFLSSKTLNRLRAKPRQHSDFDAFDANLGATAAGGAA